MSEAYLAGTLKHLPQAGDHLRPLPRPPAPVQGDRRDPPRRRPSSTSSCSKNTRYLWLKRPNNLTARQQDLLDELLQQPLGPVRAYELSLRFDDFYELDDPDAAEEYLRRWIAEVHTSGLQPLIKFTRMLEDHWLGVMRWHHSRVSNGLLEGLNSLIQAAKRRARGYRTNRNYIAMIYLVAGKLNPGPATRVTPHETWRSLKLLGILTAGISQLRLGRQCAVRRERQARHLPQPRHAPAHAQRPAGALLHTRHHVREQAGCERC